MKESKSARITISMVFGTVIVVFLSLHWGIHWSKLLLSLAIGVVAGLTFYSPKFMAQVIKESWLAAGEKIKSIRLAGTRKILIMTILWSLGRVLYYTAIVIVHYGALLASTFILLRFLALGDTYKETMEVAGVLSGIVLLFCVMSIISRSECRSDGSYGDFINIKTKGQTFKVFYDISTRQFALWGACWHLNLLYVLWHIVLVVYALIFLIICGLLAVLQAILSLALFAPFLFRAIGQNSNARIIALGILIGGLAGALSHSYYIGILVVLVVRTAALIFKDVKINLGWFYQGKINLCRRLYNACL